MWFTKKILSYVFRLKNVGFIYFGHGITEDEIVEKRYSSMHLSVRNLEKNIKYWQSLGFKFISYNDLEKIVLYGYKPKFQWIHLTFDDGYKNNLTVALPFLEKEMIPFTVFISVNNVVKGSLFENHRLNLLIKHQLDIQKYHLLLANFFNNIPNNENFNIFNEFKYLDPKSKLEFISELEKNLAGTFNEDIDNYPFEQVLNCDELVELSKSKLVTIGSHGCNHNILTTMSELEVIHEMQESKKQLEQMIGKEIRTYCYPNGTQNDFNLNIMNICQKSGYYTSFSTISSKWTKKDNSFAIPRIPLSNKPLVKKALKLIF